jgi:hypothetical protein
MECKLNYIIDGKLQNKIAISGKANSGKNTVALLLVEKLKFKNSKEKIVAIADPMKRIVKMMFPEASEECLYGPSELRSNIISDKFTDKSEKLLTHRQALIDLGAFGRQYNKNIWLNCLVQDANQSADINTYIASDVRFLNEFYYLKQAGFTMIRILRNNCSKIDDPSELEQDKILNSEFDYIVNNNGSLDDLSEEIRVLSFKLNGLM